MVATEEHVMSLLADANPVPDIESLELLDASATRYLATLDRRSSEMTETVERARKAAPERRRRLTWTAVSAVAVSVLGFVAFSQLSADDGLADGMAVAEEFTRAVSAGEADLSAYVTDDATFAPMLVPLDDDLASFWAGLETTIAVANCEQNADVVRCDYEWSNRIRDVQDRPEVGRITFLLQNSKVAAVSRDLDAEASGWLEEGDPVIHYLEWLNTTHPGWDSEIDWIGDPEPIEGGYAPLAHDDPIRNARYAEALTRHLDDYQRHLADSGGLKG